MKVKNAIENYLKESLKTPVILSKLPQIQVDKLPLTIVSAWDMYIANMYAKKVVFLCDKTASYSPSQLVKISNLFAEKLQYPCVFVFEQIASYHQSRLIGLGVNFLVINKMMYMPKLLIEIGTKRTPFDIHQKMPATAQMILLYHLECQSIENMQMADIADMMGVSYATCNKALTWLRGYGFATENKVGKQKYISLKANKWELWNNALPHMYTPIEKVLYTDESLHYQSGYNALSHYSRLIQTDEQVFAWFGNAALPTFTKEENEIKVEIWRYNPAILTDTHFVDPLSLYLILKDDDDERISLELDYMLHQVLDCFPLS